MSRRDEIKRKKEILASILKGETKSAPKKKTKKKKIEKADVNGDGKVDEKDVEEVKKRIVKKKDS